MRPATKMDMIERQLRGRDIDDDRVLDAMSEVDRALFVPEEFRDETYEDGPLPIGKGQTISQPYIVAYMAQALGLDRDAKVLEVGSGCGYNAAVLSRLAGEVYSVEIIEWLADLAKGNIAKTGYDNVHIRHGDGYRGWPDEAPFDAIELTAAPETVPSSLKLQLKVGGKMLLPVGGDTQRLVLMERVDEASFTQRNLLLVQFVPMTGRPESTR